MLKCLKVATKTWNMQKKKSTIVKMDLEIFRMAKVQPVITSRQVKDYINWPVSTVTVWRCLRETQLSKTSPRKAPFLKPKWCMQNRLKFAHEDSAKDKCGLMRVKLFNLNLVLIDGITEDTRNPIQVSLTVKAVKQSGANIMVWGCFKRFYLTTLIRKFPWKDVSGTQWP